MDALIWYVVNRAGRRYSWKPKNSRKDFETDYEKECNGNKDKKEQAIITFEYSESAQSLKDAFGDVYTIQTPFNNCLHVFIGDAREIGIDDTKRKEEELAETESDIKEQNSEIQKKDTEIAKYNVEKYNLDNNLSRGTIDQTEYKEQYNTLNEKIETAEDEKSAFQGQREQHYEEKRRLQSEIGGNNFSLDNYCQDIEQNYYYGKTLLEFDLDYISSLSLFGEKSVTAQLLDGLTGMLTINLELTYKQQLIKNEVKKMVSMITESDDLVISDCFFTFSNDDYDAMSRQAELRKAGLFTIDGNETSAVKVNAENILASLNQITDGANKEVIQTIIEGTITQISKELSNTTYMFTDEANYGIQMNFIEKLITNLAYSIVCSVVSPKIYLLLLINLKIIGRSVNFNLKTFIDQYKQLIASLIRKIRDSLLKYYQFELNLIVDDLADQLMNRLANEQILYYTRLLDRILSCIKRLKNKTQIDFTLDDVDYADILPSEEEPKDNEC